MLPIDSSVRSPPNSDTTVSPSLPAYKSKLVAGTNASTSKTSTSTRRWFPQSSIASSGNLAESRAETSTTTSQIRKTPSTGSLWNTLLHLQANRNDDSSSVKAPTREKLTSRKSLPWNARRYRRSHSDSALHRMKHQSYTSDDHGHNENQKVHFEPLIPESQFESCAFLVPLLSIRDSQVAPTSMAQLASLPAELLTIIAMKSGFRSACQLRLANRFLYRLLSEPASWRMYAIHSTDSLEMTITIMTRLHTFDHLLFGEWDYTHVAFQDPSRQNRIQKKKPRKESVSSMSPTTTSLNGGKYPNIFFHHKTFLEHYDYLGGVSLSMQGDGTVDVEFFEHRERLPCYEADIQSRIDRGELPPPLLAHTQLEANQRREIEETLHQVWQDRHVVEPRLSPEQARNQQHPELEILSRSQEQVGTPLSHSRSSSSSSIGGLRIPHSCSECDYYDDMVLLESMFVFDQVPHRPDWFQSGFHYAHSFPSSSAGLHQYEQRKGCRRRPATTSQGKIIPVPAIESSTSCTLTVCVKPSKRGMFMGLGDDDLPMVSFHVPRLNGVTLSEKEYSLFRKLVQQR